RPAGRAPCRARGSRAASPKSKLLDERSWFLARAKKHLHQTQSQEALGFHCGWGASKFSSPSEDLHRSRPLLAAPKPATMQEVLPFALAGLGQRLGSRKAF